MIALALAGLIACKSLVLRVQSGQGRQPKLIANDDHMVTGVHVAGTYVMYARNPCDRRNKSMHLSVGVAEKQGRYAPLHIPEGKSVSCDVVAVTPTTTHFLNDIARGSRGNGMPLASSQ